MLYALLDRETRISPCHLKAALACWSYCEASLRHVFGDALSDPTADAIREQLRESPEGLTRTEIRDLFGRNKAVTDINHALAVLLKWKLATCEKVDTGGRSAERWRSAE